MSSNHSKMAADQCFYWMFALALGLAPVLFERNLIRMLMEKQLSLPDAVWDKLNLG